MLLYYISGFGFGHLTRSLALVEQIMEYAPKIFLVLRCHPAQIGFGQQYLKRFAGRIKWTPFDSQFRIQFDPLRWQIDYQKTGQEIERWLSCLPHKVEQEIARVPQGMKCIVSDIVPEAFAVAKQYGVPGIAISNFTWCEVAMGILDSEKLNGLLGLYQQADLLLEYDLNTGEKLPIRRKVPAGLLCRPINGSRVQAIREQFKRPERPLVFLSVGDSVTLENLGLCREFDYLHTRGISLGSEYHANAVSFEALDTQNYLAACDAVITKCGWSTVSEALIAGKPLFVMKSSNGWTEERAILKQLQCWRAATVIEADELTKIGCRPLPPAPVGYANNLPQVARMILNYCDQKAGGEGNESIYETGQ